MLFPMYSPNGSTNPATTTGTHALTMSSAPPHKSTRGGRAVVISASAMAIIAKMAVTPGLSIIALRGRVPPQTSPKHAGRKWHRRRQPQSALAETWADWATPIIRSEPLVLNSRIFARQPGRGEGCPFANGPIRRTAQSSIEAIRERADQIIRQASLSIRAQLWPPPPYGSIGAIR